MIKNGRHAVIRCGQGLYSEAHRLIVCTTKQILREDYVSRQKRWEEEQARAAPETPMGPDDDEEKVKIRSCGEQEGWKWRRKNVKSPTN